VPVEAEQALRVGSVGVSERAGAREMRVVSGNNAVDRDAAMRDHLQWLANLHSELAHMRRSDATDEEGEVYGATSNGSTDRAIYRSIDDLCTVHVVDDETTGDAPLELGLDDVDDAIYRSISGAPASAVDADALWVRGTRPPLLKRQRACSDLFNPQGANAYSHDISH